MLDYTFQWRVVFDELPQLLAGAFVTIEVTVLSIVIGVPIALMLAAGLTASPASGVPARAIIEAVRGTPCLFQIYLYYYGLGALGINFSSFSVATFAIALNNAGYLADIYRSALEAIPVTQRAAARSLGMSRAQTSFYVVLPQLVRLISLPTSNQVIWAMLNTSLASLVGLRELTGATQVAQSRSFRTLEFFIVTASLYYLMAKGSTVLTGLAAARLRGGER